MDIFLQILSIAGFVFSFIAWLWLVGIAYREGMLHCLLMFLFGGIYGLIFTIMHWEVAKKPFFVSLLGGFLIVAPAAAKAALAFRHSTTDPAATASSPGRPSEFQAKIARIIASRMAANARTGSTRNPKSTSMGMPGTPPPSAQAVPDASNPAGQSKSDSPMLPSFLKMKDNSQATATSQSASSNEWDQARSLLKVGGILETGNQLFVQVNADIVKVNDTVAVEMNGRLYRFKVRRINLQSKTVQFDPIEK